MADNAITVKTTINAPLEKVWESWNDPNHISKWAFASDDWMAEGKENDLRPGGKFRTIMSAKDKSASFEFTGVYTNINGQELIEYDMDDGRHVKVRFEETPNGVEVTETFDPESENTPELQQEGWQSILDNFKKYAETL